MISRWTKAAFTTSIGVIAACRGAALSPSSIPLPSSIASPSSIPSPQARVPPSLPDGGAPVAPSSDGKCNAGAPKADAAFMPIALRFEQRPDGTTTVEPDVARRFPAISDDGRTIAILDERDSIDVGASLHLAILDVRTHKLALFTLWAASARAIRRREAQRALDKARWQSLIPGEIGSDDCGLRGAVVPALPALRFNAAEFQFVGMSQEVELLRRTRSGEAKVTVAPHGLPGTLGQAAVPTGDVGASCGLWDHLDAGWVSQDSRIYLFKLGASLGGRCGPAPTPVEYCSWVSP